MLDERKELRQQGPWFFTPQAAKELRSWTHQVSKQTPDIPCEKCCSQELLGCDPGQQRIDRCSAVMDDGWWVTSPIWCSHLQSLCTSLDALAQYPKTVWVFLGSVSTAGAVTCTKSFTIHYICLEEWSKWLHDHISSWNSFQTHTGGKPRVKHLPTRSKADLGPLLPR